jgi:hypothetical protein
MKTLKTLFVCSLLILICKCARSDISPHGSNVNKNELLKNAYLEKDYKKCLAILEDGADGVVDMGKAIPLLYDIYQNYSNDETRTDDMTALFNFYLIYRKNVFESSMAGVCPRQTVGSYIAHFGTIEMLEKLAENQISLISQYEKPEDTAFFNVASKMKDYPVYTEIFGNIYINDGEKKKRMQILLDAGIDVSLIIERTQRSVFHEFKWWPEDDDFTEILDRMIEKGANVQKTDHNGFSAVYVAIEAYALNHNAEAYIYYLISKGVAVTADDIAHFDYIYSKYMEQDEDEKDNSEIEKLNRIKNLLKKN